MRALWPCAAALSLAACLLAAAPTRPIAVVFGERVLELKAPVVLRAGRVLVPARTTFSALAAIVLYDPQSRVLAVRRAGRTAILTHLEQSGGRTYVPLREVARALDLNVAYDARRRVVSVRERAAVALATVAPPASVMGPSVESRHPESGEQIYSGFPAIYATVQTHGGTAIDRASVRMSVDGVDVTARAQYVGDALTYTPPVALLAGVHNVSIAGHDLSGTPFAQTWSFSSRYQPSQEPNSVNTSLFLPGGTFAYNDRVQITAIGPPGGSGYVTVDGLGTFPLVPQYSQPGYYIALIFVPANLYLPHAAVSGYIVAGGRRFALSTHARLFINSTNASTAAPPAAPPPAAQVRTPVAPPPPRVPK